MRLARTAILVTPADLATDWLEETAPGGRPRYCSLTLRTVQKWATVAMPL
jgi:hypothetical protein